MEFRRGEVLLITQKGKLFDQARIEWIEETGDGRILEMVSTIRDQNKRYKLGEIEYETWHVLIRDPLRDGKYCYNSRECALTLEKI